jgi:hypothetical protein
MRSSRSHARYPLWVRVTCCLVPVASILALSIAAIFGAEISWPVAASVAGLSGYVVRTVV